jgi:hypothetical protein
MLDALIAMLSGHTAPGSVRIGGNPDRATEACEPPSSHRSQRLAEARESRYVAGQ